MKKRLVSMVLVFTLLCAMLSGIQIPVSASGGYDVENTKNLTGMDIIAEARKWANSGATYVPGSLVTWPEGVTWRTGHGSTLYFDCIGFVSRVLNDCGFRAPDYPKPDGGSQVILYRKYGAGYITSDVRYWINYGPDLSAAVEKARNGDYSDLQPGDVLGWLGDDRHVIFYAGLNDGVPWMVEFTGIGYLDRAITPEYQSSFQYAARFAEESGIEEEVADCAPGDVNRDGAVDTEDVIQLLLHISMPELYPLSVNADFNGDDAVNTDDAIRLLLHISMPDLFPI